MKRVLLLAPDFYNYWNLIKNGIEQEGYYVDTIIYPHFFLYKLCGILPFTRRLISIYDKAFYRKKISQLTKNKYERVIIIKSSALQQSVLEMLKNTFTSSSFVSYIWDDLSIDKKEVNNLSLFDKVFSFSIIDSEKYNLLFRPMFFNNQVTYPKRVKDIDLFYIGSYETNRFDFIIRLLNRYNQTNLKMKFILRSSIFLFLSKFSHYKYRKYFRFSPIPYSEMMQTMLATKCAIELEHSGQTGLTTRPIECIATQTKLITTNKHIVKYSLYDPNNILVIDKYNPEIGIEWIKTPYKELPAEIKEQYTLSRFVKDLLS